MTLSPALNSLLIYRPFPLFVIPDFTPVAEAVFIVFDKPCDRVGKDYDEKNDGDRFERNADEGMHNASFTSCIVCSVVPRFG